MISEKEVVKRKIFWDEKSWVQKSDDDDGLSSILLYNLHHAQELASVLLGIRLKDEWGKLEGRREAVALFYILQNHAWTFTCTVMFAGTVTILLGSK